MFVSTSVQLACFLDCSRNNGSCSTNEMCVTINLKVSSVSRCQCIPGFQRTRLWDNCTGDRIMRSGIKGRFVMVENLKITYNLKSGIEATDQIVG